MLPLSVTTPAPPCARVTVVTISTKQPMRQVLSRRRLHTNTHMPGAGPGLAAMGWEETATEGTAKAAATSLVALVWGRSLGGMNARRVRA